ncbi:MAG: DUF2294 family protein [Flavobacteriales bacterium]|nr:DUF2294 family protein [Flavobacteriales bacterium]
MTSQRMYAQLEEQINTVVTQFEKELWGRGPRHIRTRIAFDTVLIKVLFENIKAEEVLIRQGNFSHDTMRRLVMEQQSTVLCQHIAIHTQKNVVSFFFDNKSITGERMYIFELDGKV